MHLIKKKIAGRELPAELPLSLIPPSLRPAQQAAPPGASRATRFATRVLLAFTDPRATTDPTLSI